MKIQKICFDIDGVVCLTKEKDYKYSKPIKKNIKKINQLYDAGYKIILYTAVTKDHLMRKKSNQISEKITLFQLKMK